MVNLSVSRILSSFWKEQFLLSMLWYLIILFHPEMLDEQNRVQSVPTLDLLTKYDYVVIGGGSAGAVIASRLSEDQDTSVLLLEAGVDEVVLADVPLVLPFLRRTFLDWSFLTEPSRNYCLAMRNHQCMCPRGKVSWRTYACCPARSFSEVHVCDQMS